MMLSSPWIELTAKRSQRGSPFGRCATLPFR
nr:MAG TPA: hypothetical protein [Caudoviricetes sp.]